MAFLKQAKCVKDAWQDGIDRYSNANVLAEGIPLTVELEHGDTVGFEKVG